MSEGSREPRCEPKSARAFSDAYTTAIYKAGGLAFALDVEETGAVLFSGRAFVIVTAHNPRSEKLSGEENERRHRELERVLLERRAAFGPSVGESPDGAWREEGVVVYDVSLEGALELGRRFEQHAVLYGQGGRVALVWCDRVWCDGGLEWFYPRLIAE